MKKNLLFFAVLMMFSLTLPAQSNLLGTWKGKTEKNGKSTSFILTMKKNGKFKVVYPNLDDVIITGEWGMKPGGVLKFKGSDEELQFKRIDRGARVGEKGGLLKFKRGNKTVRYRTMSNAAGFFGWDEGVAAVVVNHEAHPEK